MKISKSRLKQIIKEELSFVLDEIDTDEDGVSDKIELAVVDKGELSGNSLDEVLTQLFDLL